MRLFVSLLLRALWLGWVFLLGAMGMLAVGFGFSGGVHWLSFVILGLFLVTVVPAVIVGFLPWSRLRHPKWPLKLWYGWMALVFGGWLLFRGFGSARQGLATSTRALDEWRHPAQYTTFCWRGEGTDDYGIWIGLGDAKRVIPDRARTAQQCRTYRLSDAPKQVVFMSNYGGGMHPVFDIPKVAGGRTCFVVEYDGTMRTQYDKGWIARAEPCQGTK